MLNKSEPLNSGIYFLKNWKWKEGPIKLEILQGPIFQLHY